MKITVEDAMNRLKEAFKEDPGYAHAWHCNIAMACYDAIFAHENLACEGFGESAIPGEVSNDAASRFMKLCFDVETEAK